MQDKSKLLDNVGLASVLRSPENIEKLFETKNSGQLAINALKVVSGPEPSAAVDKLIEDLKDDATDSMNI